MLSGLRSKSWLVDLPLIALAWWAGFWLRFNLDVPSPYFDQAVLTTPLAMACMAVGLAWARVPRQSWRYVSLADLRQLAKGVALGGRKLGTRAVIVMPTTTPQLKIDAVKALGGEVVRPRRSCRCRGTSATPPAQACSVSPTRSGWASRSCCSPWAGGGRPARSGSCAVISAP